MIDENGEAVFRVGELGGGGVDGADSAPLEPSGWSLLVLGAVGWPAEPVSIPFDPTVTTAMTTTTTTAAAARTLEAVHLLAWGP